MLYLSTVHVNIFIMRRYEANKLLKEIVRGPSEENARKLSVEIYCFRRFSYHVTSARVVLLSMRT